MTRGSLLLGALIVALAPLHSGGTTARAADLGLLESPLDASFAFEPFIGVPGNVGDDLLRRIWNRAEREGLAVVKRPGGVATYHVEGTLTAVSNDANSVVLYVFDVTDASGQRVHRITGRQQSDDGEADPWTAVKETDLDLIARKLAALLRAWLYTAP